MNRKLNLAVIGLGKRSSNLISVFQKLFPEFRLVAVIDPDEDSARKKLPSHSANTDSTKFYSHLDHLKKDSDTLDGVLVGTPCNTHTPLAVKLATLDLPVYLEKPVGISYRQISDLNRAYENSANRVVVSFPLRTSPLFNTVLDIVRSGRLGKINQVQAVNNVPYGAEYFGSTNLRNYDVTGGLWLQKATHDFDYINLLLGKPKAITTMMTRQVYGGDMPHDLWCSKCDKSKICTESSYSPDRTLYEKINPVDHQCVWGNKVLNQDAGSALIMYEGGIHASYSQNFVSRLSAATRGAVITGYKATASFDWYTEKIKIIDHFKDKVEVVSIKGSSEGHHGGDEALVNNFAEVCFGVTDAGPNLSDGLLSATMCLAARESAHKQTWIPIPDINSKDFPESNTELYQTDRSIEPLP